MWVVSRQNQHVITVILSLQSSAVLIAEPHRIKWTNYETVKTVIIDGSKHSKLTTEERAALDVLDPDFCPTTAMTLKIYE